MLVRLKINIDDTLEEWVVVPENDTGADPTFKIAEGALDHDESIFHLSGPDDTASELRSDSNRGIPSKSAPGISLADIKLEIDSDIDSDDELEKDTIAEWSRYFRLNYEKITRMQKDFMQPVLDVNKIAKKSFLQEVTIRAPFEFSHAHAKSLPHAAFALDLIQKDSYATLKNHSNLLRILTAKISAGHYIHGEASRAYNIGSFFATYLKWMTKAIKTVIVTSSMFHDNKKVEDALRDKVQVFRDNSTIAISLLDNLQASLTSLAIRERAASQTSRKEADASKVYAISKP